MGTDLFIWHGYTEFLLDGHLAQGELGLQHRDV